MNGEPDEFYEYLGWQVLEHGPPSFEDLTKLRDYYDKVVDSPTRQVVLPEESFVEKYAEECGSHKKHVIRSTSPEIEESYEYQGQTWIG